MAALTAKTLVQEALRTWQARAQSSDKEYKQVIKSIKNNKTKVSAEEQKVLEGESEQRMKNYLMQYRISIRFSWYWAMVNSLMGK